LVHHEVSSVVEPWLEVRGVSGRFPGVQARERLDRWGRPGEVHVPFGENGAAAACGATARA
jgi:ABC-type sugar transport system ATPase subunit